MDYTILAQEELRLLPQLEFAVRSIEFEVKEINLEMHRTKGGFSLEPIAARGTRTAEDKLVTLISRKDELLLRKKQLNLRLRRLNGALDTLDELLREIITRQFTRNQRIEDIFGDLSIEKSTFYRLRSEAMEAFTRALYGVIKT